MSTPPDDPYFDESEFEYNPESLDAVWRENSDPPDWFYDSADILSELDRRESVFLEVEGGLGSVERDESTGLYSLQIHGYDEDTGEDLYWNFNNWDYEDLMDFYDYIEDYYDDTAFWPEGGSGDLSGL